MVFYAGATGGGGDTATERARERIAANRGGTQPAAGGSGGSGGSSTGGARPSDDRVYMGTKNRGLRTYGTGGARPASDRTGMGGGRSTTGGSRPLSDREYTTAALAGGASIKEDLFQDKTEVQESFYDWSETDLQQWAAYCVQLGLLSEEKA